MTLRYVYPVDLLNYLCSGYGHCSPFRTSEQLDRNEPVSTYTTNK